MHLTLLSFHAQVSLCIKVESARQLKLCVRVVPCSLCLIATTSQTTLLGSRGLALLAAFHANAITRRSLPARLLRLFATNRTRTAPPISAPASVARLAWPMLAICLREFLGNRNLSLHHFS